MKVAVVPFTLMAAGVQGQRAFLQAWKNEPLEALSAVKQVPTAGSHFQANGVMASMQCVISLTIQFMIVYIALAICRMAADSYGLKYGNLPIQKILQTATLTVNFAPMLAILFLACRMRVTQLTKGKGSPPKWVQVCMYLCTYSVLLMTLCVCAIPIFTGEVVDVDPKTGSIPEDAKPFENKACAIGFSVLKYLLLLGLYGGALAVVYSIITYVPPAAIWPEGKELPVAPALQCTMILACQYFIVYGLIQVARSWTQFAGLKMTKFENAMLTATASMNFAPMLAVLFIAARMHALTVDPIYGNPQKWAQNCFFMCTYALLAQTCFSVAVPLALQGEVKIGRIEGDMEYELENKLLGMILAIGRYVMMICLYIGACCVVYSIFTIQHPKGPEYTIPISTTVQCVVNLSFQFFFLYTWIWAAITIKEFSGLEWALMTQTMENCKGVVMFCPTLAILFVGTRMRALLLTDNRGAPQDWCQDGMHMATWSLLIQFVMVLVTPCATGVPGQVDEDGNIKWKPDNKILFYCVILIRFLGFFLLYGGVIIVIIGVYTMTPETANGRGSMPPTGDGKHPGTDTGMKELYKANDSSTAGGEAKGKSGEDVADVAYFFLLGILFLLLLLLLPLFPSFSATPSAGHSASEEQDFVDTEVERTRNPSTPILNSSPGSPALGFQDSPETSGCRLDLASPPHESTLRAVSQQSPDPVSSESSRSDDHAALEFGRMSAIAECPIPTVVSPPRLDGSAMEGDVECASSVISESSRSDDHAALEFGRMSAITECPIPTVVSPPRLDGSAMEGDVECASSVISSQSGVSCQSSRRPSIRFSDECIQPSSATASGSILGFPASSFPIVVSPPRLDSPAVDGDVESLGASSQSAASSESSRPPGIRLIDKSIQPSNVAVGARKKESPRPLKPRQYYLMDLDLLVHSGLWRDQNHNFWKVEACPESHLQGNIRRYKSRASLKSGGSLRQGAITVQWNGKLVWQVRGKPGYGWVLEYVGHLARAQTVTWRAIPSGDKIVWTKVHRRTDSDSDSQRSSSPSGSSNDGEPISASMASSSTSQYVCALPLVQQESPSDSGCSHDREQISVSMPSSSTSQFACTQAPVQQGSRSDSSQISSEGTGNSPEKRTKVDFENWCKEHNLCRRFVRSGNCKYGSGCFFEHTDSGRKEEMGSGSVNDEGQTEGAPRRVHF